MADPRSPTDSPSLPARLRRPARSALGALAVALAAATAASAFGGAWWVLDLASEFRLQWIAIGLVLVGGAVALRRTRLAVVCALCVAYHAAAISGPLLVPRAEAAAGSGPALRLTTLNLLYVNRDAGATLDYLARTRPDIAVFQEALRHWPDSLAPLRRDMPHVAVVPSRLAFGKRVMLFSRHPILDVTYVQPVPRYLPILVARIDVRGAIVTVVAAHPPHPTSSRSARIRARQLDAIAGIAGRADGPLVVAGDLNSTPWSQPFRDLVAGGRLADAARRRPWQTTWPTWLPGPGLSIDHVLVNRHVTARRTERGPHVGSDHYPLTVDLTISRR